MGSYRESKKLISRAATIGLVAALGIIVAAEVVTASPTAVFQSNVDGIRVQVPNEWIVDDIDNTDPNTQQIEKSEGAMVLAVLCPQADTLPIIGGGIVCSEGAADRVLIARYADLLSRPEFAALARENKSITTNDLLAFFIQDMELNAGFTNFRLLQNIDTRVNVIDPQTSAIIATAPAKYIVTTFQSAYALPSDEDIALLVLGNDGNTGYAVLPVVSALTAAGELPPEQQQIIDSFELLQ